MQWRHLGLAISQCNNGCLETTGKHKVPLMHFLVLELEDWEELYLLDPMEAGRFKGGKLTPENCQRSLAMRKGILMFFQSPTT